MPGWAVGAGHLAVAPGTPGSSTSAATCRADRVPSQPPQADNRTAFRLIRSGLLAGTKGLARVNVVTVGWSGPGRQVEHLSRQCCVGRSQRAGDWLDDVVGEVLTVCRLPVSAGGDRGGGPLVPALRPVLPGRRELWPSAASPSITSPSTDECSGSRRSSTRPPGRTATFPVTSGSPMTRTSRPLAGGRICTGRSTSTARSLTCSCPSSVTWPRPGGSSPGRHDPGRGHHRPLSGLSAGPRRADPLSPAYRRALCEQPGRSRSRTAESPAPAEAPPFLADPGRRACLRPEPPPRPLRTRHRRPRPPPDPHSIRPAHDGQLTVRSFSSGAPSRARSANATLPGRPGNRVRPAARCNAADRSRFQCFRDRIEDSADVQQRIVD